jgi:hypothetical protein
MADSDPPDVAGDNTATPSNSSESAAIPASGWLESRKQEAAQKLRQDPRMVKNMGRWKDPANRVTPGGRPKALPRFRASCREASFEILTEIRKRMTDPDVPLGELVKAFAELADRGSFIKTKEEQENENTKARLIVAVMALKGLSKAHQETLLALING